MSAHEQQNPKIMHVVLTLSAGGGAERLVYDMARDSAFAGTPPVVCCLQEVGALGALLLRQGIKVYCRQKPQSFKMSMVRWLASIIQNEQIDVVHAHQYTPMFYAVPAAFLAGRKRVIYTEHGRLYPDVRRWKRRLVNPLLSLGIDHIVSISEGTKRAMVEVDNFSSGKIEVIHNGMTIPEAPIFDVAAKRRSLGLKEGAAVIGTAARLEEIKNLPMLLKGFKRVLAQRPEVYLLIAGRGSQESHLKECAEELGIRDRVLFLGLRDDLAQIYPLFDVFLLTSFSEGISLTLLEAMSYGVPAVVTDVGGNPEVVVDGETGYLVPLGGEEELADRVLRLLADPGLASTLGKSGRARAKNEFGFQVMLSQYRDLYRGGRACLHHQGERP